MSHYRIRRPTCSAGEIDEIAADRQATRMGFWQDLIVGVLTAAGLGLAIRLNRTTKRWLLAGTDLRDQVVEILDGVVTDVELVGGFVICSRPPRQANHRSGHRRNRGSTPLSCHRKAGGRRVRDDRIAYTIGKTEVVHSLLSGVA